ncbi:hypothetical protein Patl1_07400 [Pistacia atlantica]|uniref:Uncharacterized protein n=1 Tax=Pistacia atlantica TaxID=434234 RepID=A0ACC1AL64_9ROSI|nr:hypothetical protein Patl1_07400 [Pistacia atlantica]
MLILIHYNHYVLLQHGSDVKLLDQLNRSDGPEREHCQSLVEIPLSIQYLNNLRILNLSHCESLRTFPSNINFRTLITLNLSYCCNLKMFPQISGNIKKLNLIGTAIDEVPSSIECLSELDTLRLWKCGRLTSISKSIFKLKSLRMLSLWRYRIPKSQLSSFLTCWKEFKSLCLRFCNIKEIPDALFCLSSLERLDLSGNIFENLPTSIKKLFQLRCLRLICCKKLRCLRLICCKKLQSIPELPQELERLNASNSRQLQSIALPASNLEGLDEAELEIISERLCSSSGRPIAFRFTNCLNLNQNANNNFLTNSQQRIQNMATVALRLCYAKVTPSFYSSFFFSCALYHIMIDFILQDFDEIHEISLSLPGSEIPGWFSHQSSRSSIIIQLPQHWSNRK